MKDMAIVPSHTTTMNTTMKRKVTTMKRKDTHGTEGECNGDHKHDAADNHQGTAAGHDETAEAAHSDEIILPKAKADAAGVKVSIVEPAPFPTSNQDQRTGIGCTRRRIRRGSHCGRCCLIPRKGDGRHECRQRHSLVTISSHNIADGDPVQRARIAYEVSKKEYERMKALVKNKIVSDKDFAQAEQNYENARISYEALAKNHSAIGQNITAPIAGYVKSILVKEGIMSQLASHWSA